MRRNTANAPPPCALPSLKDAPPGKRAAAHGSVALSGKDAAQGPAIREGGAGGRGVSAHRPGNGGERPAACGSLIGAWAPLIFFLNVEDKS